MFVNGDSIKIHLLLTIWKIYRSLEIIEFVHALFFFFLFGVLKQRFK